ncbi:MAG: M48 family metallopeptidase [Gammaproteobacteria bacterium]
MNAEQLRCQNDLALFNALLEQRDVKKVNDYLEKQAEEGPTGIRRQLLATSVRLSRNMAGEVYKVLDECVEKLAIDIPIELYVYASPQFNAACVKPEDGRLFIMFASSLLEAFKGSELGFVIGHELGHHLYRHHDIPIGYILRGKSRPNPKLALELFAWSRYAEISADRAGAHCAQDLEGVGRSLFRLTSGLSDNVIQFHLDEFLGQVDDMQLVDAEPGQGAPTGDWFSTHPFSPLRVHALKLFHESELAIEGGTSKSELEIGVQRVMAMMEPNYLEGKTTATENMRRLFFAASLTVANASNGVSEQEISVFEKFFGDGSFTAKLDLERLQKEVPERTKQTLTETSPSQRMQIMHDLCIVARADGHVTEPERRVLEDIAVQLQVPELFVTQCLNCNVELD